MTLMKNIFNCWINGSFFDYFLHYIEDHVYLKSKNIVKDYFSEIGFTANDLEYNKVLRGFIRRVAMLIREARKLEIIEKYAEYTYKRTEIDLDLEILLVELRKINFGIDI